MRKKAARIAIVSLLLVFLFLPVKLLAAPFYEGKTIRIVCGSAPGGGYDRMARLLARHLPKYLPGKPTIVVENLPGAGSIIAANNLYNLEKPNGLTIGTFNQGLPFGQLLKSEGVRFDLTKYEWIGSTAREASLFTVRSDTPYKSVNDLRKVKEPIPLATVGPNTMTYQYPSGIEDLPIDEDLTTDKRGKTLIALRAAPGSLTWPYVAPPKTPPGIMKILRNAFVQVTKDPAFLAEADRNSMVIEYVTVEETMKIINYVLNQPEDVVRDFSKFIRF